MPVQYVRIHISPVHTAGLLYAWDWCIGLVCWYVVRGGVSGWGIATAEGGGGVGGIRSTRGI